MAVKHILLAETDDSLAHIIVLLLKQAEFKVSTVTNCHTAMRLVNDLEKAGEAVDLLITGLQQLPLAVEQDFFTRMATGQLTVPVIVITGHDDAAIINGLKSIGCRACIVKPFEAETLLNSIRAVLQQKETGRRGEGQD